MSRRRDHNHKTVSAALPNEGISVLEPPDESQRSYATLRPKAAMQKTTDSEAALSGLPGSTFKPA
jgi:hypothetical protein